ncbi:hypothetical protein MMPV_006723 [Pyropia vietnamensis]
MESRLLVEGVKQVQEGPQLPLGNLVKTIGTPAKVAGVKLTDPPRKAARVWAVQRSLAEGAKARGHRANCFLKVFPG